MELNMYNSPKFSLLKYVYDIRQRNKHHVKVVCSCVEKYIQRKWYMLSRSSPSANTNYHASVYTVDIEIKVLFTGIVYPKLLVPSLFDKF